MNLSTLTTRRAANAAYSLAAHRADALLAVLYVVHARPYVPRADTAAALVDAPTAAAWATWVGNHGTGDNADDTMTALRAAIMETAQDLTTLRNHWASLPAEVRTGKAAPVSDFGAAI